MQIQMMREFLVLAETLNFLSASSDLYISQGTLSKHIHEMEKELGAPLFKRTTRAVELTELGMRTIPYARKITELYDAYSKEVEQYKELVANSLTIGCINHWDIIDLSKLTMDFQARYPGTHIQITTGESEDLLSMLQRDMFHFVIVREEAELLEDGLSRVQLCEDPLCVLLPKSHPLANCQSIPLEKLRDESFIVGAGGALAHKLGLRACKGAGFKPHIIYQGGGPQVTNYVMRGLGVGLLFRNPFELEAYRDDVVCLPTQSNAAANINIVYKSDRLTGVGRMLLEFFRQGQYRF